MDEIISIIVPAYNVETYIEKCIDSVLKQTYRKWELIIVDDGSVDRTGEISDKYAAEYNNIIAIHQNHQGVSSARNHGMDWAHGSYILFIDADDWMEAEMIQTMLDEGQHADLIVCGVNDCYLRENDKIVIRPRKLWNETQTFSPEDVYLDVYCKLATLWNKLIRVTCIGDIRFSPEMSFGEDAVFFVKVLSNVQSTVVVPRYMYNYCINRIGNVVSAKIDYRSLELLDNMLKAYYCLRAIDLGIYGVHKLTSTVYGVMEKIEDMDDKANRCYIKKSGFVLRRVGFKDRMEYLLDSRFLKKVRSKVFFVFLTVFPKRAIKLRRKWFGA